MITRGIRARAAGRQSLTVIDNSAATLALCAGLLESGLADSLQALVKGQFVPEVTKHLDGLGVFCQLDMTGTSPAKSESWRTRILRVADNSDGIQKRTSGTPFG